MPSGYPWAIVTVRSGRCVFGFHVVGHCLAYLAEGRETQGVALVASPITLPTAAKPRYCAVAADTPRAVPAEGSRRYGP